MSGNTLRWGALLAVLVAVAIAGVLPAAAQNKSEVVTPSSMDGMRDPAGQNVVMIENTGFAPDPITSATPGGPRASGGDLPPTTPESTLLPVTGAIGALAVVAAPGCRKEEEMTPLPSA